MYGRGLFDLIRKYLNCLTASWIPMLAFLISAIIHPFANYYLVTKCGLDVFGIGMAYNISITVLCAVVMTIALLAE